MKPWLRICLAVMMLGLLGSGIWYGVPVYLSRYAEFDLRPSYLAIQIHGLFGVVFLVLFGFILESHVLKRIRKPRHRQSGVLVLGVLVVVILSGYLLYYLGAPLGREISSSVHSIGGVGLVVALFWHIRSRFFK